MQISGASGIGPDRSGGPFALLLPKFGQAENNVGRLARASEMAIEAKFGLRLSDVVLAAEGDVLRAAGGRHPGETLLHNRNEKVRHRKDRAEGALVRLGLLPARFYW